MRSILNSCSHAAKRWAPYLPFLNWPRLTRQLLRSELQAGLSVALLMIPQAVAYASLAGMPLVTGLYAAAWPALIGVMFGGSTRLSIGPSALTCVLISSSLTGMAVPGSAEWVQLAIWLALLAGGVQLLLGLIQSGWLMNLISSPVMTGFTQAAALLVMFSQLPALLGLTPQWSSHITQDPMQALHVPTLVFGMAGLAALLLAKRFAPRLPAIMLLVAASALCSVALGFSTVLGGAVVGTLPEGWASWTWPTWPGTEALAKLFVPAMVIALVSFLEAASSARTEHQRDGTLWNNNQDLVGQGLAKITSALFGSFATGVSFSRSAIYQQAGARTAWSVVFTTGFVLLTMPLLSLLHHVPRAALAAIVVLAVLSLVKPSAFVTMWRINRVEAATALATFVITLASTPQIHWGVLAGVVLTLAHFLHTRLHPRIIEVGMHPDGTLRDRHLWRLPLLGPRVLALRMDAELDFASAQALEARIQSELAQHPDTQHLCLFAQPINRIDITGVESFVQLRRQLTQRGIVLHLCGLKLPIEQVLRQAQAIEPGPHFELYRTEQQALDALGQ
jgi:sulfate permease, SulP family